MNPVEKGDALAALGYTIKRTETTGVYLVTRPDRTATYSVNAISRRCSCPATVPCCHVFYVDWHWERDRAAADLAEARRRGVLVAACESALYAAEWHLRRVVGAGAAEVVEIGRAA